MKQLRAVRQNWDTPYKWNYFQAMAPYKTYNKERIAILIKHPVQAVTFCCLQRHFPCLFVTLSKPFEKFTDAVHKQVRLYNNQIIILCANGDNFVILIQSSYQQILSYSSVRFVIRRLYMIFLVLVLFIAFFALPHTFNRLWVQCKVCNVRNFKRVLRNI